MPRRPSEKRGEAEALFRGGMKLTEISRELGIPEGTVRSWKNRGKWDREKGAGAKCNVAEGKGAPNATLQRKRRGGQPGNQNAKGSKGGAAPHGNRNAEKHGFFSRHLPEDSLDIIDEIKSKGRMEILWENIQLSYAAILRAQKIMFVSGKDEMVKELKRKKEKKGKLASEEETEWEFQFAWDRQASFLTAQARAMAELRALIRQYEEMAGEGQKARVEKIKAETERIRNASGPEGDGEVDDWVASVAGEGNRDREAGGLP